MWSPFWCAHGKWIRTFITAGAFLFPDLWLKKCFYFNDSIQAFHINSWILFLKYICEQKLIFVPFAVSLLNCSIYNPCLYNWNELIKNGLPPKLQLVKTLWLKFKTFFNYLLLNNIGDFPQTFISTWNRHTFESTLFY